MVFAKDTEHAYLYSLGEFSAAEDGIRETTVLIESTREGCLVRSQSLIFSISRSEIHEVRHISNRTQASVATRRVRYDAPRSKDWRRRESSPAEPCNSAPWGRQEISRG